MTQPDVDSLNRIRRVVVIPAFNESETLPQLISEIAELLSNSDLIMVVDDSTPLVANETERRCRLALSTGTSPMWYHHSDKKTGRGGAVRRGFDFAMNSCPNAQWFLECDADGSHRAGDILRVLSLNSHADLIVGSRYLPASNIIGWSLGRRAQSRVLNTLIPLILHIPLKDVTNGLRRYSRNAVKQLLRFPPTSSTFIYLTEQALIIQRCDLTIGEIPIIFGERRGGTSSVTVSELRASLKGLLQIIRIRSQIRSE